MAKAKKPESAGEPAPKKAPAAKKAAAPKKSGKPDTGSAGAPQAPLIDTGLAAAAAAAMVANLGAARLGAGQPQGTATPSAPSPSQRQESSTFRNLKEGLNKPAGGGLGNILGPGGGQRKLNQGFGGQKPSVPGAAGRNQTFGADVNRSGVPRRTGGG
jgi:hypothetical protein